MISGEQIALAARRIGIGQPNDMQLEAWNASGRRLIILSPTGSGKTLAFAGALIRRLGRPGAGIRAVILAPSRELTVQIAEVVRRLAPDYKVSALYGQHSMTDEINSLSVMPDIVVATPGRLLDHLNRGTVDPSSVSILAIDEYDKCLELGFQGEMSRIVRRLPRPAFAVLTSATRADELPDFIDMTGATVIDRLGSPARPRLHIARVESDSRDKLDTLTDLLRYIGPDRRTIVFVNHRESAERVVDRLRRDGFPAAIYHGGLEQLDRERAVITLANGTTPILVATDLAGRGLDIEAVEAVVHYHVPPTAQTWTHRNGRTARVDARGDVHIITAPGESLPDYVVWDNDLTLNHSDERPARPSSVTYYINAGRKEKISRADIAGFMMKTLGIEPTDVGKIDLRDHGSYVAVSRRAIPAVEAADAPKIKGKRVRISRLR